MNFKHKVGLINLYIQLINHFFSSSFFSLKCAMEGVGYQVIETTAKKESMIVVSTFCPLYSGDLMEECPFFKPWEHEQSWNIDNFHSTHFPVIILTFNFGQVTSFSFLYRLCCFLITTTRKGCQKNQKEKRKDCSLQFGFHYLFTTLLFEQDQVFFSFLFLSSNN